MNFYPNALFFRRCFIIQLMLALLCCSHMLPSYALPKLLQPVVQVNSNWYCGADEDGCVSGDCLCIPVEKSGPYCLDYNDLEHPCKPQRLTFNGQQSPQCAPGQTVMPSQQACLKIYFDDEDCSQDKPHKTCALHCNPEGGHCV